MKKLLCMIKNLFKIAKVLSVDDSGDLRFLQYSALGKKQKALCFSPYGLMHNPPTTSVGLLWNQQAQGSNGICIADDPPNRILKDLAPGEVALGNYLTGSYIYFDQYGNKLSLIWNSEYTTTVSNWNQTAFGNAILNASTFELNGNGDNLVTWADLSSLLASYWSTYNSHTHDSSSSPNQPVSFDITASKAVTLKTDG